MSHTSYSSEFDRALTFYFDKKYVESLKVLEPLLDHPDLNSLRKAEVLRRIADCKSKLGEKEKVLELYDQALELATESEHSRCWILASKASALSDMNRHKEALEYYRQAIELVDDPDDLEHLEWEVQETIMDARYSQEHQSLPEHKSKIFHEILTAQKEIEEAEFWGAASGKKVIKD